MAQIFPSHTTTRHLSLSQNRVTLVTTLATYHKYKQPLQVNLSVLEQIRMVRCNREMCLGVVCLVS